MKGIDLDALEIGSRIMVPNSPGYSDMEMVVWLISPVGSGGRRYGAGRTIHAHIGSGRYGVTLDYDSERAK